MVFPILKEDPMSKSAALILLVATFVLPVWSADPGTEGDGDFKLSPPYADCPELKVRPDVPVGEIKEFTMKSADSKIYPGFKNPPKSPGTYERKVAVYIPKQYKEGTPAPFIVVQDGMQKGTMTKILDNLIHDKKVPAMVAIFINSGGGDGPGSQRGLEYDTVSGKYAEFIETEVLPRITQDYKVTFTTDPEGRATMGGSSGAACAFSMAWFHPEWYHKILSYSGTYVNQQSPKNAESPHGAWEYHENLIPKNDAKPLRIWLQVGENDIGSKKPETDLHNWVSANKRMAAALKEKKYHYHYVFCEGAGHVDGKVVRQTLADALVWLWRGYPIK